MKKFAFRLERLLHLRQALEQDAARELGIASRAAEHTADLTATSQTRRAEAEKQIGSVRARSGITAGALQALEQVVRSIRGKAESDAREHQTAVSAVERKRHEFWQARQSRHSLERLKEKQYSRWQRDVDRFEQKELDAVAQRIMTKRGGRDP